MLVGGHESGPGAHHPNVHSYGRAGTPGRPCYCGPHWYLLISSFSNLWMPLNACPWIPILMFLLSLWFSLSGTVLMLKGSVLRFAFLDCGGALVNSPYEVWRDQHAPDDPDRPRKRKLVNFSPSSSQEASGDGHLAVVCSERQARVFFMPSQACLYVHNITESSFVLRADVVSVCNSVCLACFCANGHIMTLRFAPIFFVCLFQMGNCDVASTAQGW